LFVRLEELVCLFYNVTTTVVVKNCALLGYYAARGDNSIPVGPIFKEQDSRLFTHEGSAIAQQGAVVSRLLRGGSFKSRISIGYRTVDFKMTL